MGKRDKTKRRGLKALERKVGRLEQRDQGLNKPRKLVFGLSLLDNSQGQDYEDWEEYKLLSKALSRIQGICSMTVDEAKQSQLIKEYGPGIPDGSGFTKPKHIPEDTSWCSIRIQSKVRVIGFIESNYIFQIVFLDKEHEFYPSKKKNT